MGPQTIRRIDVWLGKPGCFVLTCVRRFIQALGRSKSRSAPVEKILFIKLIEQGATVLAYSAIRRAVDMVGRENVFFCVFDTNREILDLLDVIPPENVFTIRQKRFPTFLMDTFRTLARVRRMGIDAVVDMEFYARAPAIFAYLTGARRRVGLHRFTSEAPYRGDLMTHRVQYSPYLHCAQYYDLLVQALEHDPGETPLLKATQATLERAVPRYEPCERDMRRVRELLNDRADGAIRDKVVLLNPNASDIVPVRKWATERFVELGKRILADHEDVTLVITGAPGEQKAAEEVCRAIGSPSAVSVAGKTSLRDLVVLFTVADVLVTNDSGPGHFASLTDIDAIVLFGPETPNLFAPLGKNIHVIWAGLACSPCVSAINHRFSPCTDNVCMQSISVDQVYEEVERRLAARASKPGP